MSIISHEVKGLDSTRVQPIVHQVNEVKKSEITHLDNLVIDKVGARKEETNPEDIVEVLKKANEKIKDTGKQFEYKMHDGTNQVMIKVIDTKTQEVINELPPEKLLDMVANMCEAAGLYIDEKR